MGLDDFKDDNPLKEDPPNEDKWRHEEPGVPDWDNMMRSDKETVDSDSGEKRLVLSVCSSNVRFIQDSSESWLSSKLFVDIRTYR